MDQVLQVVGALLILAAFAGSQAGRIGLRSVRYLTLNATGSAILTALALVDRQWGFFLLNGVWVAVSVSSLLRVRRGAAVSAR